jgi:predicted  nucleic acid-binding Zn-ribbon protein
VELPGLSRPATRRDLEEPTLKADPFAQLKLLDVQALDSRLDALRHQAAHLPETVELAATVAERTELDGTVRDLAVNVTDLTREQRRAEEEVEQVRGRQARDRERLDSGSVANPKDLERLQHELVSLERRIATLEDAELEVMERLEDAQRELTDARDRLAALDGRIEALTTTRGEKLAGLRAEAATVVSDRKTAASGLPVELLAAYDRLRGQKDGVGAAALRARRCGGCRLELNSSDLAVIAKRPSDDVIRCEECGRILVRTAESGL